MKIFTLLVALFGLTVGYHPAHAEEAFFPKLATCIEQSDGVFDSLMRCHQEEYERQDARVNAAYNKLSASTDPELKEHLASSQHAWVSFTEEYSSFLYGGTFGGQLQRLDSMYWLIQATSSRADDLEDAE